MALTIAACLFFLFLGSTLTSWYYRPLFNNLQADLQNLLEQAKQRDQDLAQLKADVAEAVRRQDAFREGRLEDDDQPTTLH